ncbi:Flavodoxin 1 [Seminavis robusta]|uniref:Flavodoxin 1 n=1 Tax=Seminavis robusta TaxID=568900 RepID=A0A9N8E2P1_9STRA|nr:Flavodoxin 1 [Seminavis robusta]|eukprot:Sro557_g166050.1 Flavodoxin 1 (308) ;mRNA; r:705-1809
MKFFLSSLSLATLLVLPNGSNAFTLFPNQPSVNTRGTPLFMKVGVFFGTSTGNTEECAEKIAEKLGAEGPFDVDDGDSIVETFRKYDALVVGTPTWNTGADTERSGTGWDELYYGSMEGLDLGDKKVAVFGLGDSVSYSENYADAAGELHDIFESLGCKMHGYVSTEGYLHDDSKAIRGGDKFCGLLLDMVNQEELTDERIDNWIAQLGSEGFLEGEGDAVQDAVVIEAAAVMPDTPPTTGTMENLEQLDENSSLLDQSIASHDTGFKPHTNTITGKTMWTSVDGTKCFITEGTSATATRQSTTFSA